MACFIASLLAMALLAWAYLAGHLPWWVPVFAMGIPISILHELEHDLVHNQYFEGKQRIQAFM